MYRLIKNLSLMLCCLWVVMYSVVRADDSNILRGGGDVVLKPKMRAEPLSKGLFTIKTKSILPYLDNMIMFDSERSFEELPYIVGFADKVRLGSSGNIAYAVGLSESDDSSIYTILKSGKKFIDPDTKENLGLQALVAGNAEIKQYGNPQVLLLSNTLEHIYAGARLIPRVGLDLPALLKAKIPAKSMSGYILYVKNDTVGSGKYSIVVVSLGLRNGLAQGDVLELRDSDKKIRDLYTKKDVHIEPQKFGEIIIYKCMQKVSLGFILNAERPVLVNDQVVDKV